MAPEGRERGRTLKRERSWGLRKTKSSLTGKTELWERSCPPSTRKETPGGESGVAPSRDAPLHRREEGRVRWRRVDVPKTGFKRKTKLTLISTRKRDVRGKCMTAVGGGAGRRRGAGSKGHRENERVHSPEGRIRWGIVSPWVPMGLVTSPLPAGGGSGPADV